MVFVSRLFPYVLRYRLRMSIGLFALALAAGASITAPYILGLAVDALRNHKPVHELVLFAALTIAVQIADSSLRFVTRHYVSGSSRRIEYDLRNDVYAHIQSLDQKFFQDNQTGDLMARVSNDVTTVREILGPGLIDLFRSLLLFIYGLAFMLAIDWKLGLIAALPLPLITLVFVWVGQVVEKRYHAVQTQFGNLTTFVQENFSGARVVKAYVQEDNEAARVREAGDRVRADERLVGAALDGALADAGGARRDEHGHRAVDGRARSLDGRDHAGRVRAVQQLRRPALRADDQPRLDAQHVPAGGGFDDARRRSARAAAGDRRRGRASREVEPLRGSITFDGVNFGYFNRPVLHDISIDVPAGTTLAIVGPTGSGKTTLVNLIARVYDVRSGRVAIDGHDVRDIPLAQLHRAIAFVPQESFLFSATLEENVTWGGDVDVQHLDQAVELAQLSNDLPQMPNGMADDGRRARRLAIRRAEAARVDRPRPRPHGAGAGAR